jgi:opacity protein-like surface antigen
MKQAGFALGLSIFALAPAAFAQVQGQGQVGAGGTFEARQAAYQPAPAFYTPKKPIENIGRQNQFIFGMERVTGLFFDRQTITYKNPVTGGDEDYAFKSTSVGLLGLVSSSPSAMPRFALDFGLLPGLTLGGSIMISTRAMSSSGDATAQPTAPPPTANTDGLTLFGAGRVGYAFAFDSTFSIWPRAGLAYTSSSAQSELRDPMTGVSLGTYDFKAHFLTANLEVLLGISPIEHIVVTAGPFADLGLLGGYSILQSSTEIDRRDAHLTSFGILANVAGYY